LEVLIVHDDLDAVRALLVPLATDPDEDAGEQTDGEDGEDEAAVRHVTWCSAENNKTRREAGLAAVA
jgi:hypothetical protein